ncbi:MAG: HAMP domain-containing sensor histidine kinase [Pirellulaceae bacterium]
MSQRRSLGLPITLGVVMIVLLVALIVGWVLLAVFGAITDNEYAPLYWTFLTVGAAAFIFILVGVVLYLALSVKAINLNRQQSNFIDSVTHELKSPIASLKLYLQTLHRHNVSPEEQANFFQYMLEDVERLDGLINHLLDAGRLEKQPVDEEIEDVNLAELLEDCAQTVRLRYRLASEVVRLEVNPCLVRARRVDLEMLFRNLIDNAVKYAAAQPQVEVYLEMLSDDRARAQIVDNGQGIPLALRRKIFGRFVRLGSELEREKPGTGLGLYIVRTLVTRLKGRVRVSDPESGSGTVFEVELPAKPLQGQATASPSESALPPPKVA